MTGIDGVLGVDIADSSATPRRVVIFRAVQGSDPGAQLVDHSV
ncbi:hypothetical protein ACWGMA_31285 [Streptomyces asiaticus]